MMHAATARVEGCVFTRGRSGNYSALHLSAIALSRFILFKRVLLIQMVDC